MKCYYEKVCTHYDKVICDDRLECWVSQSLDDMLTKEFKEEVLKYDTQKRKSLYNVDIEDGSI